MTKSAAHIAVYRAVKSGLLPAVSSLLCIDFCGRMAKHYDHYVGYTKENWLTVHPVCEFCHYSRHRKLNPEHEAHRAGRRKRKEYKRAYEKRWREQVDYNEKQRQWRDKI